MSVLLATFFQLLFQMKCDLTPKNDQFYLSSYSQIFQTFTDDLGNSWDRKADISKLEILLNDKLDMGSFKTCSDSTTSTQSNPVRNSTKTFKEIAKEVGFNHFHRKSPPLRPNCRFEYVILSTELNITDRLRNDLCFMEMFTGGAAVGDYDNDGFQDIFFTVALDRSILYRNNGNGTFTDVTVSANVGPELYGNGAGWLDVDADGDLDLFVTTMGDIRHFLYINQGGHFTEEALIRGVSLQFPDRRNLAGMTPTFGDFDLDGYVDIYVSEWIYHFYGKVSANRLLRNLGSKKPGYFEDVTENAGLNMDSYWEFLNRHDSGTFVFGSSFTDFNNDGWPELLISGGFRGSKLFWNNKNGTFTECTIDCGIDGALNVMGQTTGDLNKDGFNDVMLAGVYFTPGACAYQNCLFGPSGNGLFQNNKNGSFSNIAKNVGVQNSNWAWGVSFIDFDNDRNLDIVTTSGMDTFSTSMDDEYTKGKMMLFQNIGNQNMADKALEEGMQFNGEGRGLLVFDYEEDGDEDILVVPNVGPVNFFRNDKGNKNFWLRIEAMHVCASNPKKLCNSYGARVYVTDKTGIIQSWSVGSKTSLLSQSELTVHFGLGKLNSPVIVRVFWPQTKQEFIINDVPVNSKIKVIRPQSDRNSTIVWGTVEECPYLFIKDVSQPLQGKVTINQDMKSINFDPSPLRTLDVGMQKFKYTIGAKPDSLDLQDTAIVELDFRTAIEYANCNSGFPVNNVVVKPTEERRLDGKSNNKNYVDWGSVSQPLIQLAPRSYSDNISEPASACSIVQKMNNDCPYPKELSGLGSNRPSPRFISNTLMKQLQDKFSKRNLSDLIVHYGQFINHDTDHATALPRFELQSYDNKVWMPISIPKGDVHFDPYSTDKETMPFLRTQYNKCTGIYPGNKERQQLNTITAFIDGSMIYGVSLSRCANLREFKDGKMRLENSFPPKNLDGFPNENPTGRPYNQLYVAGDIRANVQPGLMAMHTIFLREHNRLAQDYQYKNPMASDEEIFQKARRIVIAELQSITYNEYLPAILGDNVLPQYTGYNDKVDPGVFNEFATAAFRFGHSQVNSLIFRLKPDGTPIEEGHAILREMYFKPHRLEREGGVDPLLRGAVYFRAQEVDVLMVDEMRNTLFPTSAATTGTQSGFDLASFNIQRGRDHGLPDLNTVRKHLGLRAYTSFNEISADEVVAKKLELLYESIDNIDLWVGGLAEDHVPRSELGETFHKIILEQFIRFRDGDRFWYEKNLTKQEIAEVESRTLGEIIRLNTGFNDCPNNVFFSVQNCNGVKDHQCIPRDPESYNKEDSLQLDLKKKNNDQSEQIDILTFVTSSFGGLSILLFALILVCLKFKTESNQKYTFEKNDVVEANV